MSVCAFYIKARVKRGGGKRKFFMFNGISFIFTQCDTNKSDQCSLWAEKKKSQYYKTKQYKAV